VFAFILKKKPTPERIAALWHVMHRPPRAGRATRWSVLDGTTEFAKWLPAAVEGYLRDREKDGLIGNLGGMRRVRSVPRHVPRSPEDSLIRQEITAFRRRLRARLRARVLAEGSARDRRIFPLWRMQGASQTGIARQLGLTPQAVQSFDRKLRRWAEEELATLQSPVAKTGVSAT
jgi:hypothetical protein